jgi:hypothetical protein
MVTLQQENGWSLSDKLAVALACLAAVTALILFWIDKTPLTAGISIACIAVLMIYPIIHFVRSRALRIVTFIVAALLVGVFGYKVWPLSSNVPPSLVEKGPQVEPKPVPKSAAPSLAESVRLITNTELRQDVKELSDNMRDFETDARQKSKALMSQTRIFVNGQPTDEASWKERVKQNSMFHATEQTDFRKRYLPEAVAYKDEMLRRLNETRPDREKGLVALQGDLEGTSPISDLADYLEWLSRRLPQ